MRFPAFVIVAALSAGSAQLPTIPPLPNDRWPSAASAEPFARQLLVQVPPLQLDAIIAADPQIVPALFRNLGTALLSRDAALRTAVADYATALVRAHAQRIPAKFSQ